MRGVCVSDASETASRSRWCSIKLVRAADRIRDRLAVAGKREGRRELDRPLERLDVVAERVGPALGPEPDRRRDPAEEMIGGDEDPVLEHAQLPVRVTRCCDELPAVEPLACEHPDRIGLIADEGRVDRARLDQLLGDRPRHAVRRNQSAIRCGHSGFPQTICVCS